MVIQQDRMRWEQHNLRREQQRQRILQSNSFAGNTRPSNNARPSADDELMDLIGNLPPGEIFPVDLNADGPVTFGPDLPDFQTLEPKEVTQRPSKDVDREV